MDTTTQNNTTPQPSPLLKMAQRAMYDMQNIINEIRKARSNVNHLVQSTPFDKPTFLMEESRAAESNFRLARTELSLWIQDHFRGGMEWLDQPEQEPDHREIGQTKFAPGHNHRVEVVNGGMIHKCDNPICCHYSDDIGGLLPIFGEGHDEVGSGINGELVWHCPNENCMHLADPGMDTVDGPRHAQLQAATTLETSSDPYSGIQNEVFGVVWDAEYVEPLDEEYARDMTNEFLSQTDLTPEEVHDMAISSYWLCNTHSEREVETAYPNC